MKLIKVDKEEGKFYYECMSCGHQNIEKQDRHYVTDFCVKCFLKIRKPALGTADTKLRNEKGRYVSQNKNRVYKKRNVKCESCGINFVTTSFYSKKCTSCGSIDRDTSNKRIYSKYVGVTYTPPRKGFQGEWISSFRFRKTLYRCGRYRDSEPQSDEYKELMCAIDRDFKIIEENAPNKRNFTDEQLDEIIKDIYSHLA